MWKKHLGFACVGLLAACSGTDDTTGATDDAVTTGISPEAIGEYALDDSADYGATLKITSVSPFLFDLTVVRKTGGGSNGELVQAMARVTDGRATYAPAADCSIAIRPRADGVEVRQTGDCRSEGFGAWVDGTGLYQKKVVAPPSSGAVVKGPYVRQNNDGLGASLKITSVTASEVRFDLTAVLEGPSERHGEIRGGKAKRNGNVATFTSSIDCVITMTFDAQKFGADVVQKGSCQDGAGFGAFIDVTGFFAQTEGEEPEGG